MSHGLFAHSLGIDSIGLRKQNMDRVPVHSDSAALTKTKEFVRSDVIDVMLLSLCIIARTQLDSL